MKKPKFVYPFLVLFFINSLAFFVFYTTQSYFNSEKEDLLAHADTIALEVKRSFEAELNHTATLVDSLGNNLRKKYHYFPKAFADSVQLTAFLDTLINRLPHINGVSIAFHNCDSAANKLPRLHSIYVHKSEGKLIYENIESYYDYTNVDSRAYWFYAPLDSREGVWAGPYLAHAANKRFFSYGFPILLLGDSTTAVVSVDYTTTQFYQFLNNFKTARIGYPYVLTKGGEFLAHPSDECSTLLEIAERNEDETLIQLAHKIAGGDTIVTEEFYHRNTVSGKMCWEKVLSLDIIDCYLAFSVTDQQIYRNPTFFNKQRKKYIRLALLFFSLLLMVELWVIWLKYRSSDSFLQICIFSTSVIMFIMLLFTYHFCLKYPIVDSSYMEHTSIIKYMKDTSNLVDREKHKTFIKNYDTWNFSMLMDTDRVNQYADSYKHFVKGNGDIDLIKVPTGVYVQTIKFLDSYSAQLTGYIWQVYPSDKSITRGVIFPDAEESSVEFVDSLFVCTTDGDTASLQRWYFNIQIREPFKYKVYPFDRSDLWIRIWSADIGNQNVLLTPDINSYRLFHPSYKPGIDKEIIVPGWSIEASYFSFKEKTYNTSFGANTSLTKSAYPELHFNMMLKRDFINTIISRIIPLMVLLFMTFSILYISKKGDALNVAIACSGLLFVAVFEHINLRKTLAMSGVVYLEYFYFITYFLLMLVAVNVSVEKWLLKRFSLQFLCNNLIQRYYWLFTLFFLLLTTLVIFC